MYLLLFCKDEGDEGLNDHEDGNGSKDNLREQDIYLPIANVARIMKTAIPQTGKVIYFQGSFVWRMRNKMLFLCCLFLFIY